MRFSLIDLYTLDGKKWGSNYVDYIPGSLEDFRHSIMEGFLTTNQKINIMFLKDSLLYENYKITFI